jgi:hypothetical protein
MSFIASTTLIFGILMTDSNLRQQMPEDRACLKTCLDVMTLMEARFPSAKHTRSVLMKILRNNNIMLDDNIPGESPQSLDGEGDAAWRSLMNVPAFPLPSDLDWLYPGNHTFDRPDFIMAGPSTIDPNLGLDFSTENFASTRIVENNGEVMDLSGSASDQQIIPQSMTPGWSLNPL